MMNTELGQLNRIRKVKAQRTRQWRAAFQARRKGLVSEHRYLRCRDAMGEAMVREAKLVNTLLNAGVTVPQAVMRKAVRHVV